MGKVTGGTGRGSSKQVDEVREEKRRGKIE